MASDGEAIERLTFPGAQGAMLAARVHRPLGPARAWALFAHCFTCGKDLHAARRISTALAEQGFAVLRFDFTGIGESEGDFADTHFSSNLDDLVAAADYLRAHEQAPSLLVGHSLGGTAVIAAAERIPEAKAVVTIGAPASPEHVEGLLAPGTEAAIAEAGQAEVVLAGRRFTIRREFLDDLRRHGLDERVRGLRRALLILHAPLDQIVAVDEARKLFVAALHPKSFVSLDQADHLLTRAADAEYVATLIAAWSARYLEEAPAPEPSARRGEHGLVVVRGGPSGFAQEMLVDGHPLRADEPASVGGTDTGPAPYGLVLAGLGACTSMTLRMYADRKRWPLEGVTVRLRHHKVHAKDCADCEAEDGKVDVIEREIAMAGPLDPAQRQRLLEIADRCPVHRTLESEIKVRTREVTGEDLAARPAPGERPD